jgi:hypothetical protein
MSVIDRFTQWWVHLPLETILSWVTGAGFILFMLYILFKDDDNGF